MRFRKICTETKDWLLATPVLPDVFDDPLDEDRLSTYLAQQSHALIVAEEDHHIIGQIRGMILHQPDSAPDLYVDNLGVAPFYRRQGIASQLLLKLRAWASEQGAQTCWVLTESENEAARAFYTAHGLATRTVQIFE